jgi:myosin-1
LKGGIEYIEGIDDEERYKEVLTALKTMNFTELEVKLVIESVAAILHLGNVNFETSPEDKSVVANRKILKIVAKLLQLETDVLEKALTERIVKAKCETILVHLTVLESERAKFSLCKVIYDNNIINLNFL